MIKNIRKKGEKFYDKEFNAFYCKECFQKFIEINQSLKYEEEFSHIGYAPSNRLRLEFYKTKKPNPIFIFEEDITKIGECWLYIDKEYDKKKEREIKIIMKFGGTFIDVTAIHIKSGKTVKTTLTFD